MRGVVNRGGTDTACKVNLTVPDATSAAGVVFRGRDATACKELPYYCRICGGCGTSGGDTIDCSSMELPGGRGGDNPPDHGTRSDEQEQRQHRNSESVGRVVKEGVIQHYAWRNRVYAENAGEKKLNLLAFLGPCGVVSPHSEGCAACVPSWAIPFGIKDHRCVITGVTAAWGP